MKSYSVKEIAEILNTNPETVRRWIRNKKLKATISSKKEGHIIYESALQEFLKSSPKYATNVKAYLAGVTAVTGLVAGGVAIQRLISREQMNQARITPESIIEFLQAEIQKKLEEIQIKEVTVQQLQQQVEMDKKQITEYQQLIRKLSNN